MSAFKDEADKLLAAGWRQCSTFYPNAVVGDDLGLPERSILVVMTQACTVVGIRRRISEWDLLSGLMEQA
ncbi:hypothetical protein GCM10010520_51640 [Rhizobium viscosum]|uniref:Uncharacterized protein n=1 Tax=Rhizobium viscosum TaxID=1673 RepID=A0ABR9IZ88_RHIVS|nr:hypothetical protein [Rhizobium viscosum]MBE1508520.1 hypothetical protein [Rhizobium viscosum]